MTHTEFTIRDMLNKPANRKAGIVERAIVAIFNLQTESEKNAKSTIVRNGVGFSGWDAKRGTEIAKQVIETGSFKSYQDYCKGLQLARKYAKQLAAIANSKQKA